MSFIKSTWYFLSKHLFIHLPDTFYIQFMFWVTNLRLGYRPYLLNLSNPKSFNEKINWLKLHHRFENGPMLADKIAVRDFVKNQIGETYLIPLIETYENANEINFDNLPDSFALKTNHGSGWNIICKNKSKLNRQESIKKMNKWLGLNPYYLSHEWQYNFIKPQLICEKLLEFEINDYKFFCFDGEPKFIQVDVDRFSNHTRSFYNLAWEKQSIEIVYPICQKQIERPLKLEEMLSVSRKLSENLKFARIDLYEHDNHVYFGEITLHPEGGFGPFQSKQQDLFMGQYINLPN